MLQVRLSQQGELVKFRPLFEVTEYAKNYGRGLRSQITKFTKRSRKNMLERFAIIDKKRAGGATFITLTYASNMQDESLSFSHLRNFLKRLKYEASISENKNTDREVVRGSKMFFCWKKEYQDRGAIHWHIMAFGLKWLDKDWLAHTWSSVIGENMPLQCSDGGVYDCPVFTRVEYCRSVKKAWYYMSKYMAKEVNAKQEEKVETIESEPPMVIGVGFTRFDSGFNIGSNLAKVGRFWGWEDRKNIPYANNEVAYINCTWEEYKRFRRDLSNLYDFLRQTLLVDSVKLFWFYDFLAPLDMFLASIDGRKVSDCIQWDKIGRVT